MTTFGSDIRACAWRRASAIRTGTTLASIALGAAGPVASSLVAQVATQPVASPTAEAARIEEGRNAATGISPRGAFLRALAVPGWGHAAIGSYTRGGFYVGAQALTAYTFLRARSRLSEARERSVFRETLLRARLASEGVTDPAAVDEALDADGELSNVRRLVEAREEQQTDLVALGLFLLLMSGADAYVSAHLARFPDPLELEARPSDTGTLDLGVRIRIR